MVISYRYSVEYTYPGGSGNTLVVAPDEREAREDFGRLYPTARIEKVMALGEARP